MGISIRREQIPVKAGTVVQGARYIHGDKPLVSTEKVEGNYDLQFANGLSSYLHIATYMLRPEQITGGATESPACFGVRTKKEQT